MKKKKKYIPPVVYNITGGVGNSVQAQNCRSGRNANAQCNVGRNAANLCNQGIQALSGCSSGSEHQPGVDCKAGPSAFGQKCWEGGFAVGQCKAGGLKV